MLATGPSGWTADESVPGDAAGRPPEVVLGAADELAAEGRFVEAMHVLLLQALADMRRRLDEQFADSLTSREILRACQAPGRGAGGAARHRRAGGVDLFRPASRRRGRL